MTTPKKITCDYPMRSTWPKFYTIDDSLDDITGRAMRTTTFADLHYNEYRISEHGYISGFDEDIKFPQLLTGFSGDVIFYLESNQSYFNFIAKVKLIKYLRLTKYRIRLACLIVLTMAVLSRIVISKRKRSVVENVDAQLGAEASVHKNNS